MQLAEAGKTDVTATAVPDANTQVALTGGSGFIGRHLSNSVSNAGYQLRYLSRSGQKQNIPGRLIHGDLNDPKALAALVDGAQYVIHCAGAVRGASPTDFDSVNLAGLVNLTAAIRESAPQSRLIHFSSLAAREPQLSDYANSKAKAERYLAGHCGDLDWIIIRPPAVYGPGDKEVLPLFKAMAHGILPSVSPTCARLSLIYVQDLADLVLSLITHWPEKGAILEPDDGHQTGYSFADIARVGQLVFNRKVRVLPIPPLLMEPVAFLNRSLARVFRYRPMLTPGKLAEIRNPDWVCDNSGIAQVNEWRPKVKLEQGMRLTMNSPVDG